MAFASTIETIEEKCSSQWNNNSSIAEPVTWTSQAGLLLHSTLANECFCRSSFLKQHTSNYVVKKSEARTVVEDKAYGIVFLFLNTGVSERTDYQSGQITLSSLLTHRYLNLEG